MPVENSSETSTNIDLDDFRTYTKPVPAGIKKLETSVYDEINLRVQERIKEQRLKEAEIQREYDEKRRIDRERHEAVLASSRATIEKNKQVLESTQGTLDRLQQVINGIKDTEQKFQDFQDAFGKVMAQSLEKCFGENVEELQKKHGMPKESSIEEVASIIASASSISIITGAGVSAESGVFTYKESTET